MALLSTRSFLATLFDDIVFDDIVFDDIVFVDIVFDDIVFDDIVFDDIVLYDIVFHDIVIHGIVICTVGFVVATGCVGSHPQDEQALATTLKSDLYFLV